MRASVFWVILCWSCVCQTAVFCANPIVDKHGYWRGEDALSQHRFDARLAVALAQFFHTEKAQSIVDFGCGTGDYVKTLLQNNFYCEGYDGNPDTPKLSGGVAQVLDLSQRFQLKKKFDWVLSLEVGEHIPQQYERIFIENLHRHNTKGIVLSWAVKRQGGFGHVNEQSNEYIKDIMFQLGYRNDIDAENALRKQSTFFWFKNTIMVFRKD